MNRKPGEEGFGFDPSLVGPNTYISLKTAAWLAFPDGSIGISCLRGEAKRGRLVVWRVGNKDMTTLAEVAKMVDLCRVQPSSLDSGSERRADFSLNGLNFTSPPSLTPELVQATAEIFAQRILSRRGRKAKIKTARVGKNTDEA